jgi:hypothetical protein
MIKKLMMAASVLLVIMAVIYLSARSHLAKTIATGTIDAFFIVVVVGGSLYKLTQWWHYRHDPINRERAASPSQVYPARLRRFFYDEVDDKAKRD